MECPEVWSFSEPEPLIHMEEFNIFPEDKLGRLPFGHLISVILPNAAKMDSTFAQNFCKDCQYYKIQDFSVSTLLDKTFLYGFVRKGCLGLMSVGTRIDCDDCGAVTNGKLILRLTKDTYEELTLQGKISHFTKRIKDSYTIHINLKDKTVDPDRTSTKKLQESLSKLDKFQVILCWEPPSDEVCPSSIAKFLETVGYKVTCCSSKFQPHVVFTKMIPQFSVADKLDHDSVAEFIEWLGMVSIDGSMDGEPEDYVNTYEPPTTCVLSDPTQVLQFKGFFLPHDILKLAKHFREYKKKPWTAIYVQGFSDNPVEQNIEEHQYFLNGDNGFLTVFNDEKSVLVNFGCSRKRLK